MSKYFSAKLLWVISQSIGLEHADQCRPSCLHARQVKVKLNTVDCILPDLVVFLPFVPVEEAGADEPHTQIQAHDSQAGFSAVSSWGHRH